MIKILRLFLKVIWAEQNEALYLTKQYNKFFNKELVYNWREL